MPPAVAKRVAVPGEGRHPLEPGQVPGGEAKFEHRQNGPDQRRTLPARRMANNIGDMPGGGAFDARASGLMAHAAKVKGSRLDEE